MKDALKKAKQIAKSLQKDNPDLPYLRTLLKHLKKELRIPPAIQAEGKPYIPTDEEMAKYYDVVWKEHNMNHIVMIKTFLYTGVKVGELIYIKLEHVDLERCQIKIEGKNARIVPFPKYFREVLAIHMEKLKEKRFLFLFESTHKKPYSERGVRKILNIYAEKAGIKGKVSSRTFRHFLFKWMQKNGIEESFTATYSGHKSPAFLSVYRSFGEGQKAYDTVIDKFPV